MSVQTATKQSTKSRWQITFPQGTALDKRIERLLKRYEGMSLVEITKLALIELDDHENSHYDDILDNYYDGKMNPHFVGPLLVSNPRASPGPETVFRTPPQAARYLIRINSQRASSKSELHNLLVKMSQ